MTVPTNDELKKQIAATIRSVPFAVKYANGITLHNLPDSVVEDMTDKLATLSLFNQKQPSDRKRELEVQKQLLKTLLGLAENDGDYVDWDTLDGMLTSTELELASLNGKNG